MVMGWAAAAEWPTGTLLTKGKAPANQPIASGASYTMDVPTSGDSELTVQVQMSGGASGDLAVVVTPYTADGLGLGIPLTAIRSNGPTFVSPQVLYYGTFDVLGFDKVQIKVTNNNAGAQSIGKMSWQLD